MKIIATEIKKGMTIQVSNLFDYIKAGRLEEGCSFSIETIGLKKSSPIYKVESITEPVTNRVYRTQFKANTSKRLFLTLEGVEGLVEISTKQKVELK